MSLRGERIRDTIGVEEPLKRDSVAEFPMLARFWNLISGGGEDYRLTRFFILRLLGLIYAVAFLVAFNQLVPLVGEHGLTPANRFLASVQSELGSVSAGMSHVPTLFWFGISDKLLRLVSLLGFLLSLLVLCGYANAIIMAILWILYLSIVHIGQIWYGYGWEIQTLETGLLAVFLCPLFDWRPFPRRAPPLLVIWLYRWLGFRIMVGAGLIKLRGDSCWRDLTCMYYHYETQPIPNPLSRYLHFAPHWFHKVETAFAHLVELVAPLFSFGPRLARHVAGLLMISFQVLLIVSGNLSFLNWLTIIPFIACLDDGLLRRVLPRPLLRRFESGEAMPTHRWQTAASAVFFLLVAYLSFPIVTNLLSGRQVMNSSYDPLDVVNTYGAFGVVGRELNEIVFEGTADAAINIDTQWREYEFQAKPGDPMRRPAIIAPYQCRIDWQIWFAAIATPSEYPWTLHFVWKLLHNDPGTLSLLANNPFPDAPPKYIRARLYRYRFAPLGRAEWWERELLGEWLPASSLDNERFRAAIESLGWSE